VIPEGVKYSKKSRTPIFEKKKKKKKKKNQKISYTIFEVLYPSGIPISKPNAVGLRLLRNYCVIKFVLDEQSIAEGLITNSEATFDSNLNSCDIEKS